MNKSDIAAKIKNAIEEKLLSLGAYVDKELPEYILVMIANKKSKESMSKDLQLFLGQETTSFIEWLHDLLEKCQTNPEDAFRIKSEKPLKSKPNNSPDKKKKVDKEKQKIKSKSRKSDDKKDHKKGNLNKSNKNKSRSRSPKSENTTKSNDVKNSKSKITQEKVDNYSNNKREIIKIINEKNFINSSESEIERKKEDTYINEKTETNEPKPMVATIASTVKVTERPSSKKETFKSCIEMVQRDLKEAEADIANKTIIETITEKQTTQRTSVFTRLGTNDLRAKLNRNQDENQEKLQLKRTIQTIQSDNDIRESKLKRLENDSPSPCFIVTLKGADKLNIPLTSRLGPKRNQEIIDSIDDEVYNVEVNDEIESENCQDNSKENTNESTTDSQLTRCKFWPSCKNKETCPYLHPSEPCKTFPSCRYGALCLYIHPNCKFSTNCTKPDCPYTHYGPRMSPSLKSVGQTLSRCLYYPHCTNVNCKFFHPNLPCKFGLSCKQKDSCLFYHPSIPKMTELKWTANQDSSNPSMLETSSKKAEIQTA